LKRCLLIDSDADARAQLAHYLQGFDLSVTTADSAAALRSQLAHQHFDVLLMDLDLPDEDGLQLCSWVQQAHRLPLIALSHAGGPVSRVEGLEHGADEVIERPCEPRELVAHVRALLRRVSAAARTHEAPTVASPSATCLQIAGWQLRLDTRLLRAPDGETQVLDPQAFSLLHALAQRPREVLQRSALAACLPGSTSSGQGALRRVDQTVGILRRALHDTPPQCRLILTVRGAGYVLDADVQAL
jgi:two-component system OmpR family response regulator